MRPIHTRLQRSRRSSRRRGCLSFACMAPARGASTEPSFITTERAFGHARRLADGRAASTEPSFITTERQSHSHRHTGVTHASTEPSFITTERSMCGFSKRSWGSCFNGAVVHHDGEARSRCTRKPLAFCFNGAVVHHD